MVSGKTRHSLQAVGVLPEEPVDVLVLGPGGADDALLVRRRVRHHNLCMDKGAGGQLSARKTFLMFKDRQQEAERYLRYLTVASSSIFIFTAGVYAYNSLDFYIFYMNKKALKSANKRYTIHVSILGKAILVPTIPQRHHNVYTSCCLSLTA